MPLRALPTPLEKPNMTQFSLRTAATALALLSSVALAATAAHAQIAYAIASGGTTLISFNVATPGTILSSATINGNAALFPGGVPALDALAFRPSNGVLYGYDYNARSLFTVNTATGSLTSVGNAASASPNTNIVGMSFNPLIDRVRVVSDATDNIVYDPSGGAAPNVATNLAYPSGNPAVDGPALVNANAYSNNVAGGFNSTTQYGIDYQAGTLVTIANNLGTLATVGSLGLGNAPSATTPALSAYTGLSIFTSLTGVNTAYALADTNVGGATPTFYNVNLATGAATNGQVIGGGFTQVYGLAVTPLAAVVPEAGTLPLALAALAVVVGAFGIARARTATRHAA